MLSFWFDGRLGPSRFPLGRLFSTTFGFSPTWRVWSLRGLFSNFFSAEVPGLFPPECLNSARIPLDVFFFRTFAFCPASALLECLMRTRLG